MKLSFSNIAWSTEDDEEMYAFLQSADFMGLELAPTRVFPHRPYDLPQRGSEFADTLRKEHGLSISSMQSIWYGRDENIFASEEDRKTLIDYTRKAIDFAAALSCPNLVFGCPRNRSMPDDSTVETVYDFFRAIAGYAIQKHTVIALEPNPTIYGTNFINRTTDAFAFVKKVDGLAVNIDLGTVLENEEDLQVIADNLRYVNHVHISEPGLEQIKERSLHRDLYALLRNGGYDKYISVEMKNLGNLNAVKKTAEYVRGVFLAI